MKMEQRRNERERERERERRGNEFVPLVKRVIVREIPRATPPPLFTFQKNFN
jgi:hypothetical protein